MNKNYFRLFILTLIMMPITTYSLVSTFNLGDVMCWILGVLSLIMVVLIFVFAVDTGDSGVTTKEEVLMPVFGHFRVFLIWIFILSLIPLRQPMNLWNQSVVSYNNYIQKCQQRPVYYDKMYKSYTQKKDIAFINQGQFTIIAKILMEGRKDGQNLAWKWLNENQSVPFTEFSAFWKDLSSFIETQREGYYQLETECQQLANQNNILLSTFPNNVYNWVLRRPVADYHSGFTSDQTEQVFSTRKENLK